MPLNYDPHDVPDIPADLIDQAKRNGLHIIHILCDEPGSQVGDQTSVTFLAAVAFVPRVGDFIRLEDGGSCQVDKVIHVVTTKGEYKGLGTNVYALRI